MIDFTDIDKNLPGGDNMGGLIQKVYFGRHEDVANWPTKPVAPTTLALAAVLTGDLVMKSGKKMSEMYLTDDTGEFKIDPVGEIDGKSFVENLSFFHPGLNEDAIGFMNLSKNESLVFIVVDSSGQKYLMGDELRPAINVGGKDGATTGKETSSRRGMTFAFSYKCANVLLYKGNIPLTPAV
jgi:hypothetical protein